MRRSTVLAPVVAFAAAFAAHVGYHAWRETQVAAKWVSLDLPERTSIWTHYVERQDYFMGYSYALAAAFTAMAVTRTVRQRRQAGSILGGVGLMGGVYAAGCFLIGCCGSPMLAVYLSLFGSSVLGMLKPIVAAITTLSVVLSSLYLIRRSKRHCCGAQAEDSYLPGDS